MIAFTIISSFLLDLSNAHAAMNLPGARNQAIRHPVKGRYRNIDNTGAPCGGVGYRKGQKEPELDFGPDPENYKKQFNYPSMDGPSEKFGGPQMNVQLGSTFHLPLQMIANHGGFHFVAAYCTGGKAPPTDPFFPYVPEGWTILKLSKHQPKREEYEEIKIRFMTCDTYIPAYPSRESYDLYYDVPQDLCGGQQQTEAMITWVWESVYRQSCIPMFYANRCDQPIIEEEGFYVYEGMRAVWHYEKSDSAAKRVKSVKKKCGTHSMEVWYNCIDVTVVPSDEEREEEQGQTTKASSTMLATEAPSTEAPSTEAPSTEAPSTEATTNSKTTDKPADMEMLKKKLSELPVADLNKMLKMLKNKEHKSEDIMDMLKEMLPSLSMGDLQKMIKTLEKKEEDEEEKEDDLEEEWVEEYKIKEDKEDEKDKEDEEEDPTKESCKCIDNGCSKTWKNCKVNKNVDCDDKWSTHGISFSIKAVKNCA